MDFKMARTYWFSKEQLVPEKEVVHFVLKAPFILDTWTNPQITAHIFFPGFSANSSPLTQPTNWSSDLNMLLTCWFKKRIKFYSQSASGSHIFLTLKDILKTTKRWERLTFQFEPSKEPNEITWSDICGLHYVFSKSWVSYLYRLVKALSVLVITRCPPVWCTRWNRNVKNQGLCFYLCREMETVLTWQLQENRY